MQKNPTFCFTFHRETFQVWRIEDLELAPVDPEGYGYFYGGDCYLILYTYLLNNKKCYLLYIWQVS